mgnify:CR=1 FL=1
MASTLVTVEGQPNRHAVLVSTVPEAHCALGKLVDNGGAMHPVYIEAKDTMHKPAAKHAFKSLLEQRVGHDAFTVEVTQIYDLVRI